MQRKEIIYSLQKEVTDMGIRFCESILPTVKQRDHDDIKSSFLTNEYGEAVHLIRHLLAAEIWNFQERAVLF